MMIVFDLAEKSTFKNLEYWIKEEVERNAGENIFKIIVGNKKDLENERIVSFQQAFEYCISFNIPYIETSCKTNENMNDLLLLIVYKMLSFFYDLPPIPNFPQQLWDEKTHFYFPQFFKDSVFSFLLCLKKIGFRQNKKIPKFVLFDIIKTVSLSLSYSIFVNELSTSGIKLKLLDSQLEEPIKKNNCLIF